LIAYSVVSLAVSRDIGDLHENSAGHDGLTSPFCELAVVVLHFSCQDSARLLFELLSPVASHY
jgi:hypothetical protein